MDFLPVSISIKNVTAALKKGGLLPADYCIDRQKANQFIKSAVSMGFHYEEAKNQVIYDQNNIERTQSENNRRIQK